MRTVLAVLVTLAFSGGAPSASFDCQKASTPIEHSICMDTELSKLDSDLGNVYSDAITGAGEPDSLRAQQRMWISETRNKCMDTECLKRAYSDRIMELTGESVPEPLSDKEMEQWEAHSEQSTSEPRTETIENNQAEVDAVESTSVRPLEEDAPITRNETTPVISDVPSVTSTPSSAAITSAVGNANKLIEDPKRLLKLLLIAILGSLVILAILGASDRVVVFYNYTDAWWSISPLVFLVGSAIVAKFLAPPGSTEFAATDTEKAALAVGIFSAVVGMAFTIINAVRYNRSLVIGLPVGIGKIVISGLMAVTFVGSFRGMFDSRRSTRQVLGFALVVMLVGFLWKMLVNGDRVYRRKGWSV